MTGRYDQSVTGYTYTVRETRNWLQTFTRHRPILYEPGFQTDGHALQLAVH